MSGPIEGFTHSAIIGAETKARLNENFKKILKICSKILSEKIKKKKKKIQRIFTESLRNLSKFRKKKNQSLKFRHFGFWSWA